MPDYSDILIFSNIPSLDIILAPLEHYNALIKLVYPSSALMSVIPLPCSLP